MPDLSISEVMNAMPMVFVPERAAGVSAVVQYHLTGAEPGDWVITIADGQCTVQPGTAPNPKLTLTISSEDYKSMALGQLDGMAAFMQGKLRLSGDMSLAMKFNSFFKTK